ncbi:hypothetical protein QVN97_02510 [Bacteroides caecigallinarum]|nr:hypothetical protein [Bacteroides caecigallinarum]
MNDKLVVKEKTTLSKSVSQSNDLLVYYGIPEFIDEISKSNRTNIMNSLECGTIILDALNQISDSQDFVVEIPQELRQMINEGKAHFDDSHKSQGKYTPNIRIKGEKGIKGQACIGKNSNTKKITGSMSSLAMMAMIQSVIAKLDDVCEFVQDILKGQQYDRISKVIGSFKAFVDLYPYFKSEDEMQNFANVVNLDMQQGLSAIHQSLDNKIKKLSQAPKNNFQVFYREAFRFTTTTSVSKYREIYKEFIYEMRLYSRLIILSDIILGCKGLPPTAISQNHKSFNDYCDNNLTTHFLSSMEFLIDTHETGLREILEFNKSLALGINQLEKSPMNIECNRQEIKYLNN